MFQGLRTVIYHVEDLTRAKEWYGSVLGIRPYFDEPFYVGFDVGGFELGLQPEDPGLSREHRCDRLLGRGRRRRGA